MTKWQVNTNYHKFYHLNGLSEPRKTKDYIPSKRRSDIIWVLINDSIIVLYTKYKDFFFIDIDKFSFIVHNELKYVGFNKVHITKICQIIKPNNRLEFHSEYFCLYFMCIECKNHIYSISQEYWVILKERGI